MRSFKKSNSILELERLELENNRVKYPDFPEYARPKFKHSDKTANGLTKAIIQWLRLNGCHAERVNTIGVPMDNRKVITDCIGRQKQVGSVAWRKSNSTLGSADIHSLINGKAVFIEVKIGPDRQSDYQKQYQKGVERAGGLYIIAKDFEGFYNWFNEFTKGLT
jgi:hypothetical protein